MFAGSHSMRAVSCVLCMNCSSLLSQPWHRLTRRCVSMASTHAAHDLAAVVQPAGYTGCVVLDPAEVALARCVRESLNEQQASFSMRALPNTPEHAALRSSMRELYGLKSRLDRYEDQKASGRLDSDDKMKVAHDPERLMLNAFLACFAQIYTYV